MKPIYHNTRGDETEKRFLKAVKKRTRDTPRWFRTVKRASPAFDAKGLDIQASIKRPDDSKPMTVPVQIKSSDSGRRSYLQEHPEAKEVGVPVIVITDTMTPDAIRHALYKSLEPFLSVPRSHFKGYLEKLGRERLSKRGRAIKEHIVRTRRAKGN